MTQTPPPNVFGATPIRGKDGQYFLMAFAKYVMVERTFRLMGREDLLADERFSSIGNLQKNRKAFLEILNQWVQGFESTDELVKTIQAAKITVSKVNTIVEAIESPQVTGRSLIAEMEHPRIGKVKVLDSPIKFSKTTSRLRSLAPELGEHNEYVMRNLLKLSTEEIASLYEQGILFKR
jgi:formyl-CoA transferase